MSKKIGHWINGEHRSGASTRSGDVYNPATGKTTATLAYASADDTREAILAARAALPDWAARTPLSRARVMFRFKALMEEHFE